MVHRVRLLAGAERSRGAVAGRPQGTAAAFPAWLPTGRSHLGASARWQWWPLRLVPLRAGAGPDQAGRAERHRHGPPRSARPGRRAPDLNRRELVSILRGVGAARARRQPGGGERVGIGARGDGPPACARQHADGHPAALHLARLAGGSRRPPRPRLPRPLRALRRGGGAPARERGLALRYGERAQRAGLQRFRGGSLAARPAFAGSRGPSLRRPPARARVRRSGGARRRPWGARRPRDPGPPRRPSGPRDRSARPGAHLPRLRRTPSPLGSAPRRPHRVGALGPRPAIVVAHGVLAAA
jgi:hypothetical protein